MRIYAKKIEIVQYPKKKGMVQGQIQTALVSDKAGERANEQGHIGKRTWEYGSGQLTPVSERERSRLKHFVAALRVVQYRCSWQVTRMYAKRTLSRSSPLYVASITGPSARMPTGSEARPPAG
jgi:hypothetical protein